MMISTAAVSELHILQVQENALTIGGLTCARYLQTSFEDLVVWTYTVLTTEIAPSVVSTGLLYSTCSGFWK